MQKIGYVIVVDNNKFISADSRPNDLLTSDKFEAAKFFGSSRFAEDEMGNYIMQQNRNGDHSFKIQPVALLA